MPLNRTPKSLWDWKLYFLILAYAILPSVYSSYSLYLIGNELPSAAGLAIAAQWQFVQIILEVVQEATVLPIFFFLGSQIGGDPQLILARLKTSFTTILLLVLILIGIIFIQLENFIDFLGTDQSLKALTKEYLSIKIGASLFTILNMGAVIAIESLNKKRILFWLIVIKAGGMIFLDSLFFGGYFFSLQLGIRGAAYSNLIIEGLVFLLTFFILLRSFNSSWTHFFSLPWLIDFKLFRNIGIGSGIESLVKNVAYFALIIKLINELGPQEISAYYLSMHLFWSFLLVPVLAGVETARALISNYADNAIAVYQVLKKAMMIGAFIIIGWLLLLPFWDKLLILFSPDVAITRLAKKIMTYLLIPYILLALNLLLNSLFYGLGKTQYTAYKSLITNGTVYLAAYLLYLIGFWEPTLESVLMLFGIGIIVGSVITLLFVNMVLKNLQADSVTI